MKVEITKNWLKANCAEPELLSWWEKKCKNLPTEETLKKAFKHKPRWALWLLAKLLEVPRRIKVSIFAAKEVSKLLEEKYSSCKADKKNAANEAIKEIYDSPYLGDAPYTATAIDKAASLIGRHYAEGITDSYQPGPTFYESALAESLKGVAEFVRTNKKGLQKKVFKYGLVLLKGQPNIKKKYKTKEINSLIKELKSAENISDGFHTFGELYDFRKVYNAALFNEWAKEGKYDVHKAKKHFDGEECFGGEVFVVVAMLPGGQITNHYKMDAWDIFNIPAEEKAKYEYDGHSPQDVLVRLKELN